MGKSPYIVKRSLPAGSSDIERALDAFDNGRLAEAEELAHSVLAKHPKMGVAWNLLGVIRKRQGQLSEAVEYLEKSAKLDPGHISPWVNLGNIAILREEGIKAVEYFTRAVKLKPKDAEYTRLLASAYLKTGQLDKSMATLQSAMLKNGRDPQIRFDIVNVHFRRGDYVKALDVIEKGLAFTPDSAALLRLKAIAFYKTGRLEEAIALLKNVAEQHPQDVNIRITLGDLYCYGRSDRQTANAWFEQAYVLAPNHQVLLANYCDCLLNSRYDDEGVHIEKAHALAARLLDLAPSPLAIADAVQSVFLRTCDYARFERLGSFSALVNHSVGEVSVGKLQNQLGRVRSMEDRRLLLAAHRTWGKEIEERASRQPIRYSVRTEKRPRIRIGIMSSDLRHHPVTYFAQPILQHYDRTRFELFCYSFYPGEADKIQSGIAQNVDAFRLWPNRADHGIAQGIADDDLDILFELGGTTLHNKASVLTYRPAPVQVSWLGYAHSLGLSTVDYILVDPYLKPEDPTLLLEKPFEMPESWVSLGSLGFHDIPIESCTPEERRGYLTFGTANGPYKYTAKVLDTWAEIVSRVDGARFLFIRPEGAVKPFREHVLAAFAARGVSAERVEFDAVRGKHMPHYNKMDIALDPFPHVGGTTTCEALWMGVPTVTLVGPAFCERISYSNLTNAGLGDLCAFSREQYIEKALALAADKLRRAELRRSLRDDIRRLPLGDTTRFVRAFEAKVVETLENHS